MEKTKNLLYGKLYYDSGELWYEGYYKPADKFRNDRPRGKGVEYYKTGGIYREGIFTHGGLKEGKEYYPSGKIKYEGHYKSKAGTSYYGPTYPISGRFYLENGELVYEGEFKIEKTGALGYPKVVFPKGFGPLK